MILPGPVLAGITLPGVMVHELGHELMCRLTKTKVIEVCYYRWGNPAGYVVHERPDSVWKSFFISFVPFVFNSLTGFLCGLAAALCYRISGHAGFFPVAFFYLGTSMAFHAFPSLQDAKAIDDELWKKDTGILPKIVCAPFVFVFALHAVLAVSLIDMAFGLFVGGIWPFLCLGVR